MFKRFMLAVLSTAMLLIGAVFMTASPAQADQRPCVSQAEYNHVITRNYRTAWTMAKVQDHFDIAGVWIAQDGWEPGITDVVRQYRKCSGWAADSGTRVVGVWFRDYGFWDRKFHAWAKNPNTGWNFASWLYF